MEYMKTVPDKYFKLAIVDPPYGIGFDGHFSICGRGGTKRGFDKNKKLYDKKNWDYKIPDKIYFDELFRISINQIICGGNYFNLPLSKGWIFWHKKEHQTQGPTFSDGELIWTSFNKVLKYFKYGWIGFDYLNSHEGKTKIHPTQKPVALYRWLLINYAKKGDKIFDSHVGSGSSLIACIEEGFEYVGCELDKDYYNAACKRIEEFKKRHKRELFKKSGGKIIK